MKKIMSNFWVSLVFIGFGLVSCKTPDPCIVTIKEIRNEKGFAFKSNSGMSGYWAGRRDMRVKNVYGERWVHIWNDEVDSVKVGKKWKLNHPIWMYYGYVD